MLEKSILKKQILGIEPLIIIGGAVRVHGQERLERYACEVSKELAGYPNTMLQYSPAQILASMVEGRSVVVTDISSNQLLSFAQIWKYGESAEGKNIYEFGSWLAFNERSSAKGAGRLALQAGIVLGNMIDSQGILIAIVEQNNLRAQKLILSIGAVEIEGKCSPILRTVQGEPAWMKRFDITMKGVFNMSSKDIERKTIAKKTKVVAADSLWRSPLIFRNY